MAPSDGQCLSVKILLDTLDDVMVRLDAALAGINNEEVDHAFFDMVLSSEIMQEIFDRLFPIRR